MRREVGLISVSRADWHEQLWPGGVLTPVDEFW